MTAPGSPLGSEGNGRKAPHMGLVGARQVVLINGIMGEALTQLFESDARFEPCERLAQAEMLALTKIKLTIPWAVDINCVGSIKLPLISTSRSSHQGDARTLWDRHSMHFESTARGSPLELRGGIEPQEFFDGLRNQMRFVPDPLPKRWIPEEVDQRVPDELGRRLCTGLTEKRDEANHLRICLLYTSDAADE